jgi:sporulation protein YlmC with PRC-barrel domain
LRGIAGFFPPFRKPSCLDARITRYPQVGNAASQSTFRNRCPDITMENLSSSRERPQWIGRVFAVNMTAMLTVGLKIGVLLCLAPLCFVGAGASPGSESVQTNPPPDLLRFSHLTGKVVENRDGLKIGTLRDVWVDERRGRIRFVVIAPTGILASRTRLRAIPPEFISTATAKRDVLALNLTPPQWESAPTFKLNEVASLSESASSREIRHYYRELKIEPVRAGAVNESAGGLPLTPTDEPERVKRTNSATGSLASELVGASIMNSSREKLGEIIDLLVAFDEPGAVFVLVTTGRLFKEEGRTYAVPLKALNADPNGTYLLDADRSTLSKARWFNSESLPGFAAAGSTSEVFRFDPDLKLPFNTERRRFAGFA